MRRLLRLLPHRAGPVGGADGTLTTAAPTTAVPTTAAQHRADRRAVARRLHPDLGGDVERYLAALAEVDRRYGLAPDGRPAGGGAARASTGRSRRSGLRRRVNRAARATRQRLPRHAPGARRYARL